MNQPRMPIGAVDSHAHVIGPNAPIDPVRHPGVHQNADVTNYLALLDQHGVQFGLLTAPSFYGTNNAVLLQALAHAPDRLRGTTIVPTTVTEDELAALKKQGVCGLRLNWIRLHERRPDLREPQWQDLLAKAKNLNLHIELYLEGEYLSEVMPILAASGVKLVIDHFGHPDGGADALRSQGFQTMLAALDTGNTWVKFSAPYRLRHADPSQLADAILLREYGASRVVWGTDWPWLGHGDATTYEACVDNLFRWVPQDALRHQILVETPQTLFGFKSTPKE